MLKIKNYDIIYKGDNMKIKIGVSARHLHLSKEDLEYLFGENYELHKFKDLSQKGEFASAEQVTIKTEKGSFDNVRVLGPIRKYTQVEISKTDAYKLGIDPPVRNSGDIEGSTPITICYNGKELKKEFGCIIATRHIHMSTRDLFKLGFKDKQMVKVIIGGEKGGILDNVYIKANDNFELELHLDTDDANAHLVKSGDICEVMSDE
jgi:putative phosphotransacetylase